MVFIGFFVLLLSGVLITLAGLVSVRRTAATGVGTDEKIYAFIVLGLGLGLIYLACRFFPLSVIVS